MYLFILFHGNNCPLRPHEWVVIAEVKLSSALRGPLFFFAWFETALRSWAYTWGKRTPHLHLLQTMKITQWTDNMPSQWTDNLRGYPITGEDRTNLCMDNREYTTVGCWTPHLHHRASSTSQCVLCNPENHDSLLYYSTVPTVHVSAACS